MAVMAKNMSDLAHWLRLDCHPPLQAGGIQIHSMGWHGRDTHSPFHPHWGRRHYGLVYLTEGLGFAESAYQPWRPLHPGDCFCCYPELWHNYGPQPGHHWVEYYCFFDGPTIEALVRHGLLQAQEQTRRDQASLLPAMFTKLLLHGQRQQAKSAAATLFEILTTLLPSQPTQPKNNATLDNLTAITTAICADPGRTWSFPALAAGCGMRYDRFRKCFKRRYALPPQAWLLRERLHLACRLLAEGNSVANTATAVGMPDPFHFSRRFKTWAGISPRTYAQSLRQA
jgi:AraC-like DNA-binding protein